MKTIEIITGIIVGAIVFVWLMYLAARCLGSCRNYTDAKLREPDSERHINPKK